MRLKSIIYEDYSNYRRPALFLGTCLCDWKCERESKDCHCQNSSFANYPIVDVDDAKLVDDYMGNSLTHAIVVGGLEPMLQFPELIRLIDTFRKRTDDPIVIYTGYYEDEIANKIKLLRKHRNIILKVGRYIPNDKPHLDEVLGVELASSNQRGIRLS